METVKAKKKYIKELLEKFKTEGDKVISDEVQQKLRNIFNESYDPPTGEDKFQDDEIKKFFIARHRKHGTWCIHILLADESISTMGLDNLIKNPGKPRNDIRRKAFRSAIDDQIKPYRKHGMEVDHNPPFYITRDEFLKAKNIAMEDVVVEHDPGEYFYKFKDPDLESDWFEYHKSRYLSGNGKLETVTPEENQRRLMEHFKNSNTSDSSATASAGGKY